MKPTPRDEGDAQPMPNIPKGGPLEKFFRQFGAPGMGEPVRRR